MHHNYQKLIDELKALWGVEFNDKDHAALQLIEEALQTHGMNEEDFRVQQKVLLKTRERTEMLLKRLEALESDANNGA